MLRSANGKDQAKGGNRGTPGRRHSVPLVGMYEPVQICVELALAPCESVLHGAQVQLERTIKKEAFRSALGPIEWDEFFESDGLLYDMKRFQILDDRWVRPSAGCSTRPHAVLGLPVQWHASILAY